MVQVINDPNRQSFGQTLSTSLSSALEGLASHKLGQMQAKQQQTRTAQGLEALLGIPSQEAHSLALLDPNILEHVVKQKLEAPGKEAYASALQSLLGGVQPESQQFEQNQHQVEPEIPYLNPQKREALKKYVGSTEASKLHSPQELALLQNFLSEPIQEAPSAKKVPQLPRTSPKAKKIAPALNERQATELAKLGVQLKKEERVQEHKEKALSQRSQEVINKETAPFYKETLEQDRTAKKIDQDTQRMLKLIDKGHLPNPVFYKIFKDIEENVTPLVGASAGAAIGGALGIAGGPVAAPAAALGGAIGAGIGAVVQPIASLLRFVQRKISPDTEEFEKLSANFISGAKAVFGSRITDQDLRAFMQTIPTLSNTEEGKRAIIRNMQLANKATEVKAKNMRSIIKENGGNRPYNLQEQVEDRSSDQLDKLAKEFIG